MTLDEAETIIIRERRRCEELAHRYGLLLAENLDLLLRLSEFEERAAEAAAAANGHREETPA